MQLYTVYLYLKTALRVSGWYFHPSSGTHKTVAIFFQINTKHTNTVWAERTVVEC
jgi:hypothetical protein